MTEIRIVGPQFSDPLLYVQWLSERFDVKPTVHSAGKIDRYLELNITVPSSELHILSTSPAYWDVQTVNEVVLAKADSILLFLNRVDSLTQLNIEIIQIIKKHADRLNIVPIVAANDPYGNNPKFPTISTDYINQQINAPWPVVETTIGSFEHPFRCSSGAELLFSKLLIPANVPQA